MLTRMLQRIKRPQGGEAGQAYLEFVVVFGCLAALAMFLAVFGWHWWTQVTAATAIHDATTLAAVDGGDRAAGYDAMRRLLGAALGGAAGQFEGKYAIFYVPAWRSAVGSIGDVQAVSVPFLGGGVLTIKAASVQRTERFYGGAPEDFE